MIKNAIFVILFILLYGGLFLFLSKNDTPHTDRNGYGEFTGSTYDCERFSMKMEYDESWLIYDGKSVEESLYTTLSREEIENTYGAAIDNIRFIGGAATPDFTLVCIAAANTNRSEGEFDAESRKKALEYMKTAITDQGGTVSDILCYTVPAPGQGKSMLVYGYDYEISGERFSNFFAYTNSGSDTILFSGTYTNENGLKSLTDFVENKVYFYTGEQS